MKLAVGRVFHIAWWTMEGTVGRLCGAVAEAIRVRRFSSLAPTAGSPPGAVFEVCEQPLPGGVPKRPTHLTIIDVAGPWVSPTSHAVRYTAAP